MIRIALLVVALLLVSCAGREYMYRYDQGLVTASVGAMECRDTLHEVNDLRLKECRRLLDAGNPDGSSQCLDKWLATYKAANGACKELKRLAQAAFLARNLVASLPDAKLKAVEWTGKLLACSAKVIALYTQEGIVAPEDR